MASHHIPIYRQIDQTFLNYSLNKVTTDEEPKPNYNPVSEPKDQNKATHKSAA